MAKKKEENKEPLKRILPVRIVDEMRKSFIEYSMSVITDRALPDVRDGLKPVHRRILYAMKGMNLTASAKFRKSAAVVGEVLGKYHPHGDSAVYDSMVNMAQEFNYRYPLVIGQGNFGSVDGDNAAASRYTEAKMSKVSEELLLDIEKDTVDFQDNYDATQKEPVVLPAALPGILLNGVLGIAVGMATNIPPHNLGEVVDACTHLIENPEASNEDLLAFVEGPDFPLGGVAFSKADITRAYTTGRGGVVVRGEAEVVEDKKGKSSIVITSIPYRVNRSNLIIKIADLVRDKKLKGIKDIRDESTDTTRIVVELKNGEAPQRILNTIYKKTDLETSFNYNMTVLVDGVPQLLSLRDILVEFLNHRRVVVTRRTEYDLRKAEARAHILEGLKKALDHIDEVIKVIKKSKDTAAAKENLMKKFKFTEIQAQAILEMRLQKLAGLERKAIEDELKEKLQLIKDLKALLASPKKISDVVAKELKTLREKYGDERRTRIMKRGLKDISDEDLIPDTDSVLVFTQGQYIKRTDPAEYRAQKRGGMGVSGMDTKDEDVITHVLVGSGHSTLLFFTDKGKVYSTKMYELPEGKRSTKGKSIRNFIGIGEDEKVTSILIFSKDMQKASDVTLSMITQNGVIKRVALDSFKNVRANGLIAIGLRDDDLLLSARFTPKEGTLLLVTRDGQSIRFKEADARVMGRTASGVRGINLREYDKVVGVGVIPKGEEEKAELLVVTENGYGKRTLVKEYKVQKRGGSGIKTANITEKTGAIVGSRIILDDSAELIAISQNSQIIRTNVGSISVLGRATQGVRIMKLKEKDTVASITLISNKKDEIEAQSE
jgi:DNA gyrase subunit A